jgi:hypothetical protein
MVRPPTKILKANVMGDIRVIGLVSPSHTIEDIARSVPHGVEVIVEGHLAVQSKDLWTAISQQKLIQLPSVAPSPRYRAGPNRAEVSALEEQVRDLHARMQALEAENKALRGKDDTQTALKLDAIIEELQKRPTVVPGVVVRDQDASIPPEEVVDGTAPMFLPDKIHPEDASVRIDVQGESAPSEVISAADRLRKIKKGEI